MILFASIYLRISTVSSGESLLIFLKNGIYIFPIRLGFYYSNRSVDSVFTFVTLAVNVYLPPAVSNFVKVQINVQKQTIVNLKQSQIAKRE
jgi:hypothetical protein